MAAGGQAGFGTSRIYRGIGNGGVAEGGLFFISGIIATRAGHVGVAAGFGTGGSFGLVVDLVVAKSINNLLCYKYFFTDRALLPLGQAGGGTGRSNGRNGLLAMVGAEVSVADVTSIVGIFIGMSCRRNSNLCHKHGRADRAMAAGGQTSVRTSRGDRRIGDSGVPERGLFGIGGVVTARAGDISIVADRRTGGRFCGVVDFVMTKSINNLLCYKYFFTDRALLPLGQAGGGTGRSNGRNGLLAMVGAEVSVADVTSIVGIFIGMSCRRNSNLCHKHSRADRAVAAGGQAGFSTGRSDRRIGHRGVPCRRDNCLCHKHSRTDRAVAAGGQAGFSTGRGDCRIGHRGVACRRDGGLCHKHGRADRAMAAGGQAGFGTSRIYRRIGHRGVACCRDGDLWHKHGRADRAMATFGKTGVRTGRGNRLVGHRGVAEGGPFFISGIIATRASHVGVVTGFGTGGSFGLVVDLVMAKRCAVRKGACSGKTASTGMIVFRRIGAIRGRSEILGICTLDRIRMRMYGDLLPTRIYLNVLSLESMEGFLGEGLFLVAVTQIPSAKGITVLGWGFGQLKLTVLVNFKRFINNAIRDKGNGLIGVAEHDSKDRSGATNDNHRRKYNAGKQLIFYQT